MPSHSPVRHTARALALPALAIATVAALAACSAPAATETTETEAGGASSAPVTGGTLVYASGDAEPTCLDPHVGGNFPQALVGTQFLESLVSKSEDGEIVPWLATDWEVSEDGLTWTFTLKDGVTFTDGTALDADAIAANIEHVKDPDTGSSTGWLAVAKVEKVTAVDDLTAEFTLSEPDSALLDSLSQPWLAIESPAGLERGTEENCAAPIGTGPFAVESWTKQDAIHLVRNEDYTSPPADAAHEGPAYLDAIDWRFIPDSTSRFVALQQGQVDIIDNAQPDTIVAAEKDDKLVELNAPRPGASNRLELNTSEGHVFADAEVREAFIRSLDLDAGIQTLFFGTAERSFSALSSAEKDAYSDPSLFTFDLDEANTLLDQAGWTQKDSDGVRSKDGERLTLVFPVSTNQSVPAEISLFEQIQEYAGQAGFEVVINQLDLASWYGALGENEYDIVSAPYTKVGPDVLRILYHSDSTVPAPSGYFANHAWLRDDALDGLLADAAESQDADERSALYEDAQKIILESLAVVPLYDQQNHFLLTSELHGTRPLSVGAPTFYDSWLAAE